MEGRFHKPAIKKEAKENGWVIKAKNQGGKEKGRGKKDLLPEDSTSFTNGPPPGQAAYSQKTSQRRTSPVFNHESFIKVLLELPETAPN